MKKILSYFMLTAPAICLLSCSSVNKVNDLKQDAINCGKETTVWESLPASAANPYDVTVTFDRSICPRAVVVLNAAGKSTTVKAKLKPMTFSNAIKITLQCGGGDVLSEGESCAFTVTDVRRPAAAGTPPPTVTIDTNNVLQPVTCGSTVTAFSTTNATGADVTILWQSSSFCKAVLTAERGSGTTNIFLHDPNVDKELSTIRGVTKLTFNCSTTASSSATCYFQIVETEFP